MLEQHLVGFPRLVSVNVLSEAVAHEMLRRGVFRYAPAVLVAVPVDHVPEVADYNVALRLQPVDDGVKALVAAFAVITQLFQAL